jgi:hypothetical protein
MTSVAVIINSCFKFYKTTIGPIIESAKKAKIPSQNIYVVVGESDEETGIIKQDDYNIIYCKFVNIDFNGIIYFTQTETGLSELKKYTHFFYIHDTCLFMDCFWDKIVKYAEKCDEYIKLEVAFTKNIGLLNVDWFIKNKKELFKYFINYDKSLALDYKTNKYPNKKLIYDTFDNLLPEYISEDSIFSFKRNDYGFVVPVGIFFENKNKLVYEVKLYNSNDCRLATEYNEPGFIKYQKNYNGNNHSLEL